MADELPEIPCSFQQAKAFIARVTDRLRSLLDTGEQFPCRLTLSSTSWDWGGPLNLYLQPDPPDSFRGTFEGKAIAERLNAALNQEFAHDPSYEGIRVQVPNRLLGKGHVTQQDDDNEAYRRIRLGKH